MYGDTETVRRRAGQLRDQGADVRALAEELVARVEAVGWSGRAAEAMAQRVAERAGHLRHVAEAHTGAADALSDHAAAVDSLCEEIARIETRAEALVADAQARVGAITERNARLAEAGGDAPAVEPDPTDTALLAFVPPPPGHRDWLHVELPGLER
ncbi:hypothetical protein KG112_09060 [Nocardioides sp. zg-ZUI104]|uniref:WXG100 family type VII secretion target n=1 Tax=Nocardioides faecalis TaxID=2803858 RepID=UPI001BCB53CF|nr:hypothetical protein [Nocardioides faecalis]MBS4752954.1 hypothetical protein [Nocardioides faecalis]